MKKVYPTFIMFIILFFYQIHSGRTSEEVSRLHSKISQDLLSIKKEYPPTQPKIYSALDQVSKIYQISKNTLIERKELKTRLNSSSKEFFILKTENSHLKQALDNLKNKLNSSQQELENKSKTLANNTAMLGFINKEKEQIQRELYKIKEAHKQILSKPEQEIKNKNLENDPLDAIQSVNLTSTCAPNSPL